MTFTETNHYVPQWYQRRFLPPGLKEQKFHYLDLAPERVVHPDGSSHIREAVRRLGAANCFAQDHLYTLFFGEHAADVIEKRFFGAIDRVGADAVAFFSNYEWERDSRAAFNNILRYMDAQALRTPKGLDFIKQATKGGSHQKALELMGYLWQFRVTIWTEGVWEVLCCDESATKFLVTDHPVTTYNKGLFPLSKMCQYPLDAPIELLGTHTIFPLDLNRCLVITNLGYVRNPWVNPLKQRENPRYFQSALFDLRKVQTRRQISENYVRTINYVLKKRARRFIAAANKEWLYPEQFLKETMWNKLGGRFFLMPDPRKVTFSTQFMVGYKDGRAWGADEYGRQSRDDDPKIKALRDAEWQTFEKAKRAWDTAFGELPREEWLRYMG